MSLLKNTKLLLKLTFILFISTRIYAETIKQELPMYGGVDRSSNPEFVEIDNKLIKSATRTFGTREHASEGYVERGFEHYSEDKFDKSMWRFNQAWILDQENPYVYLGFGLILNKKEQACEAITMFKLAKDKGLKEAGFLADYAYISTQCALQKEDNEKLQLFTLSNDLHNIASQTPNLPLRAYVYHSWAKAYLLQDNISKSKEMIELSKNLGGKIDPALLESINKENI